ncbi:MAG: hypothetical protein ABJO67_18130 [Pseudoruegeria sp.]
MKLTIVGSAALVLLVLTGCNVAVGGGGAAVSTTVGNSISATSTYIARNNFTVVPDRAVSGQFEVFPAGSSGASHYWCAAGQYVIEGRGFRPSTKVYLARAEGASKLVPGRKAATFTTNPSAELLAKAESLPTSYNFSVKSVGENRSAEGGRTVCKPINPFFFD